MANIISRSFFTYLLVGLANTTLTLIIISILYYFNYSDQFANFFGILGGVIQSVILNSKYTFQQKILSYRKSAFFTLVLIISYLINLFVLNICLNTFNLSSLTSQVFALIFYVISSYLLLKTFVFKENINQVE